MCILFLVCISGYIYTFKRKLFSNYGYRGFYRDRSICSNRLRGDFMSMKLSLKRFEQIYFWLKLKLSDNFFFGA